MTDAEITRLCARAMRLRITKETSWGIYVCPIDGLESFNRYDPLHDDAQMVALGKSDPELFEECVCEWASMIRCGERPDLNRIVCTAFAKMQQAKP